jgi:hypothetical protein
MGKSPTRPLITLCVGCESFKKVKDQPIAVLWNFKLIYLHKCIHSHYQKEEIIKNRILFLLEEYVECISYLGKCGQPCIPWLSFVVRNQLN